MIVQNDYPYEILFRLAKDGSVAGCHRRDLRVIEDDVTGQIYSEQELDPVAITPGAAMDAVLGTINTSLLATIAAQDAEIADLTSQLDVCMVNNQSLSQQLTEQQSPFVDAE